MSSLSPSASAATGATLSANWTAATGSTYSLVFSNGATAVNVTLTNGSTAATWATGVSAATGSATAGPDTTGYDGYYVATITGANTFTYAQGTNPGTATILGTYTVPAATLATLDSGTTINILLYEANAELNTKGLNILGSLAYSTVNSQTIVKVGGTLSHTTIIGTPSNWFIGTNGIGGVPSVMLHN